MVMMPTSNDSLTMNLAMDIPKLHLPTIVTGTRNTWHYTAILAILFLYWCFGRHNDEPIDVPEFVAGKTAWMFKAESMLKESYKKFPNQPYQIRTTEGRQVVIPPRLVSSLKSLPETTLSASEAIFETMQTKYTNFTAGHNASIMTTIIKTKLTHNITRLTPQLHHELAYIATTELPPCQDWTPVHFQPFALRAIARLTGRISVGEEINRNEEWMDASINYAVHVFMAVVKLQMFPEWAKPFGRFLVAELGQIDRDIEKTKKLLGPVIQQRLQQEVYGHGDKADDLIQWFLDALPENERGDVDVQAKLQLVLGAASIHTTNNLLTDCMYDLAARPDVQLMLRQEVEEMLVFNNGWNQKDGLSKLRKMDSFIKEVQRLSGNITSFIRKAVKPIDLSNGIHLPTGTRILAPQSGISTDNNLFTDPETFDALRFYKLRQAATFKEGNRFQFTSINDTNLNFGAGKHACPGRFLAGHEIKLCLAYLLLNYDVVLRKGEERPKPFMMVMTKIPDPKVELMFRRRVA